MKKHLSTLIIASIISLILIGSLLIRLHQNKKNTSFSIASPETESLIQKLEKDSERNPKNKNLKIQLAHAYLQKIRETADIALYQNLEILISQIQKEDPKNAESYNILATIEAGRHHFIKALEYAEYAHALNPNKASYLGLIADSQIELGEYEKAKKTLQTMVDTLPDFNSWSRIAYIRELYGDTEGAKIAIKNAIDSGSNFKENVAWAEVELGKIESRSDLTAADLHFKKALALFQNYPPALEGLGKIAFAKNEPQEALAYFEQAFSILPIAQYATAIGDIHISLDNTTKANQQYFLAKIAFESSKKSGVDTDLEYALFLADHDLDVEYALTLATLGYKNRPNVNAADILAWTLYKNKNYAKAEEYSKKALTLGEHDALALFHSAMINNALGDTDKTKRLLEKAFLLNPHFSIQYAKISHSIINSL